MGVSEKVVNGYGENDGSPVELGLFLKLSGTKAIYRLSNPTDNFGR